MPCRVELESILTPPCRRLGLPCRLAISARPRQAKQYCKSIRVRVPSPSWSVTVKLVKVDSVGGCEMWCRSSYLMAPVQAGESDDKICTVRSAGGEAGQGEGGRGFFTFRRTLGERLGGHDLRVC